MRAAKGKGMRRVARPEREGCGDGGQKLHHKARIQPHGFAGNISPGLPEQRARPAVQDAHPDFGQNPQRRPVDCGHMVRRQHLGRGIGPDRLCKGGLVQRAGHARTAPGRADAGVCHCAACAGMSKSRGAKGASRPARISAAVRPNSCAVLCP